MGKRILFASCTLVILVVSILAGTGSRLKTRVARETWEYKVIDMGMYDQKGMIAQKVESTLNELGGEGWELVSLVDTDEKPDGRYQIYLKRRR